MIFYYEKGDVRTYTAVRSHSTVSFSSSEDRHSLTNPSGSTTSTFAGASSQEESESSIDDRTTSSISSTYFSTRFGFENDSISSEGFTTQSVSGATSFTESGSYTSSSTNFFGTTTASFSNNKTITRFSFLESSIVESFSSTSDPTYSSSESGLSSRTWWASTFFTSKLGTTELNGGVTTADDSTSSTASNSFESITNPSGETFKSTNTNTINPFTSFHTVTITTSQAVTTETSTSQVIVIQGAPNVTLTNENYITTTLSEVTRSIESASRHMDESDDGDEEGEEEEKEEMKEADWTIHDIKTVARINRLPNNSGFYSREILYQFDSSFNTVTDQTHLDVTYEFAIPKEVIVTYSTFDVSEVSKTTDNIETETITLHKKYALTYSSLSISANGTTVTTTLFSFADMEKLSWGTTTSQFHLTKTDTTKLTRDEVTIETTYLESFEIGQYFSTEWSDSTHNLFIDNPTDPKIENSPIPALTRVPATSKFFNAGFLTTSSLSSVTISNDGAVSHTIENNIDRGRTVSTYFSPIVSRFAQGFHVAINTLCNYEQFGGYQVPKEMLFQNEYPLELSANKSEEIYFPLINITGFQDLFGNRMRTPIMWPALQTVNRFVGGSLQRFSYSWENETSFRATTSVFGEETASTFNVEIATASPDEVKSILGYYATGTGNFFFVGQMNGGNTPLKTPFTFAIASTANYGNADLMPLTYIFKNTEDKTQEMEVKRGNVFTLRNGQPVAWGSRRGLAIFPVSYSGPGTFVGNNDTGQITYSTFYRNNNTILMNLDAPLVSSMIFDILLAEETFDDDDYFWY